MLELVKIANESKLEMKAWANEINDGMRKKM
jgi:hypothetical protein